MAAPEKVKNKDRSTSYKIYVNYKGKRENKRFSTRQLAIDWAAKRKTADIERIKGYTLVMVFAHEFTHDLHRDDFGRA